MRYLKFLTALALGVCAAAAYADPPGRVGRVNYASGAVSFAPAEAPDQWAQASLNRPLTAGDRLWADANSRAELHIGSTALRMGAQTNVDVLNLDDHTIQLRLAQGDLTARVRDLPPGDRIEIATPSGAVLIQQPGSYRINVEPQSDSARLIVNFGQAQVVTPAQALNVPSSQSLWFANGAPPQFEVVTAASADPLDRWVAERDRVEDRIASTRYVSPQMTGYEDLDQYGTWRTYPEYGAVWVPTRVASGWAPYRHGHWAWISPWGWTWVDDAPWGFAPFHYGRWVQVNNGWAWAPGTYVARPVYAPALVAFIGGSNFSVSVSSGPSVGWFPLGWREPYRPWYQASPTYVRNVNVTHVTNVTNITNVRNVYINQANPQAVTVVPQQAFVSARPVAQSAVQVQPAALARAQVVEATPAQPVRASFAQGDRRGQQPPASVTAREVVGVTAPAKPAVQTSLAPQAASAATPSATPQAATAQPSRAEHDPRVRVIARDRPEGRVGDKGGDRAEAKGAEKSAAQPVQPAAPAPATAAAPASKPAAAAPAATAPAAAPAASAATAATAAARPPANVVARPPENVARPPADRERQERDRERGQGRREFTPPAAPPVGARVEPPRPQGAPPEAPRPQAARPEPPVRPQPPQPVARPEPTRPTPPQVAARPEAPRPQQPPRAEPPPKPKPQAEPAREGNPAQQRERRERERAPPPG